MNDCARFWTNYMEAIELSRRVDDPRRRRALIRAGYLWLNRYFDAEDREVASRERLARVRNRVR